MSETRVIYVPPSDAMVQEFVREVCQQLGQEVDPAYDTPDFRHNFGAFLKLIAAIHAKSLSSQASEELDSDAL